MKRDSNILIIDRKSLVGARLLQRLKAKGFKRVNVTPPGLNIIDQKAVYRFFREKKPEYLFFIDVASGGIMANYSYPADFIYNNLQAQNNIIHFAWKEGIKKLIFVGSSCAYPKDSPQPMKEGHLLTGPLEPTSEAFAIAKIAGIKMCQYYNRQYGTNFISVIPATIYGRGDNFDLNTSHVIPALIRKFHEAKVKSVREVSVWGTGKPKREFLHVEDMVDACIYLMKCSDVPEIINIGAGSDISIRKLAELIKQIVGFNGRIKYDASKPDGTQRKLLDISRLKSLGWRAQVDLRSGLKDVYNWYTKGGAR